MMHQISLLVQGPVGTCIMCRHCHVALQVSAIGKFEGKGAIGLPGSDSVKGQHLLPFLPAFTAFVTRLQELLTGMHLLCL